MHPVESRVLELSAAHKADKILVLTDSNVDSLTADLFAETPRLVVEAGEGSKTIAGAERVWRFLIDEKAVRHTVLVNIGGGMISDLGGFAAATFKRGIGCINLPTTLLAAVDAAIGGKTGINFGGLKNEVGAFALPLGVFPLTSLFGMLPEDEWLSGVGEAIKTGMLDSERLFELTTSEAFIVERNPEVVREVVEKCAAFKNRIVHEDFREGGKRKILNLGHTAGHAIESWKLAHGTPMPHGVAVAHGLRFTLERSCRLAGCDPELLARYDKILEKYCPPLDMTESELEEARAYMAHDKKNIEAGRPSWVLLRAISQPVV